MKPSKDNLRRIIDIRPLLYVNISLRLPTLHIAAIDRLSIANETNERSSTNGRAGSGAQGPPLPLADKQKDRHRRACNGDRGGDDRVVHLPGLGRHWNLAVALGLDQDLLDDVLLTPASLQSTRSPPPVYVCTCRFAFSEFIPYR